MFAAFVALACATDRAVAASLRSPSSALEASATSADYGHPAWLGSCTSIYLDVGSNLGVQVRKLFEPQKYPHAPMLPLFTKYFGDRIERTAASSGLCALGLEPNPEHLQHLVELEDSYAEQGWHVHFYPMAAWGWESFMAFNTTGHRDDVEASAADDDDGIDASYGAHVSRLIPSRLDASQVVRTVNLVDFIRSLPEGAVRAMKLDVEGAEYEILPRLIDDGVLCQSVLQGVLLEVHPWGSIDHWGERESFSEGVAPRSFQAVQERMSELADSGRCLGAGVSDVLQLDDETYAEDVDESFGVSSRTKTLLDADAGSSSDVLAQ